MSIIFVVLIAVLYTDSDVPYIQISLFKYSGKMDKVLSLKTF